MVDPLRLELSPTCRPARRFCCKETHILATDFTCPQKARARTESEPGEERSDRSENTSPKQALSKPFRRRKHSIAPRIPPGHARDTFGSIPRRVKKAFLNKPQVFDRIGAHLRYIKPEGMKSSALYQNPASIRKSISTCAFSPRHVKYIFARAPFS